MTVVSQWIQVSSLVYRGLSLQPGQPQLTSLTLTPQQLQSLKAQLDLVLLALECLTGVGSEAVLEVAAQLGLDTLLGDRVSLWRLRQASPLRKGQGRKRLDVEEARALVLVIGRLAAHHRGTIRSTVAALERALEQNQPVHRVASLGNYLDSFTDAYQERMAVLPVDQVTPLALKLLVDLLFYSGPEGTRKLWLALLDRSLPE